MSERDIIIERLERKLVEKEKKIEELKKIAEMNVEELKSEIFKEISKGFEEKFEKLKNFESKVVELSKTVESLMDEILYLKSIISKENEVKEVREVGEDKKDDIIICD